MQTSYTFILSTKSSKKFTWHCQPGLALNSTKTKTGKNKDAHSMRYMLSIWGRHRSVSLCSKLLAPRKCWVKSEFLQTCQMPNFVHDVWLFESTACSRFRLLFTASCALLSNHTKWHQLDSLLTYLCLSSRLYNNCSTRHLKTLLFYFLQWFLLIIWSPAKRIKLIFLLQFLTRYSCPRLSLIVFLSFISRLEYQSEHWCKLHRRCQWYVLQSQALTTNTHTPTQHRLTTQWH